MNPPKIIVLATGGTLAGTARSVHDNVGYTAAQIGIGELLAAIPSLHGTPLLSEQVAQIDSKDMDAAVWIRLLRRCAHWLAQDPRRNRRSQTAHLSSRCVRLRRRRTDRLCGGGAVAAGAGLAAGVAASGRGVAAGGSAGGRRSLAAGRNHQQPRRRRRPPGAVIGGRGGVRGLAVAGTGNGTNHHALEAALRQAVAEGVRVVRTTRCAQGPVLGPAHDVFETAGGLSPVKARIALQLDLLAAPRRG